MIPEWRRCKQCQAGYLADGPGERCDGCDQWPDDLGCRVPPEASERAATGGRQARQSGGDA